MRHCRHGLIPYGNYTLHILCALHLDMHIYCPTFAALQHQFDMLYPPESSAKHNVDPHALATFCCEAYEIRAWCNYAMFHLVDVFFARMGRLPIHHAIDDNMIGTTLLDIDLSCNLVSTLSHHGVLLFQVEVKNIRMMYDPQSIGMDVFSMTAAREKVD